MLLPVLSSIQPMPDASALGNCLHLNRHDARMRGNWASHLKNAVPPGA
jgi:hypothetical protein